MQVRITARRFCAACAAALVAAAIAAPIAAADDSLVPIPESGIPGVLSLSSSVYPLEFPVLQAAETYSWQLGLTLSGSPAATAALQLTAAGALAGADGYVISVDECALPWEGTSGLSQGLACPSGSVPRIPATALAAHRQDVQVPLRDLLPGTSPYLRFTLSQPGGAARPGGTSLTLGIGITAMGDDDGGTPPSARLPDEAVPPGRGTGSLSDTGAAFMPALFAGAGLLLLGAAAIAMLRRTGSVSDSQ